MTFSAVAWVPDDDPERDWSVAAALAAAWVEDRCREEDASGVLVTNTLGFLGVPELEAFEGRHTRTSRRAARARVGSGRGPVLSYVPYVEELEFAMGLARHSSLAVVETVGFPIAGWARWLRAWNLIEGTPAAPLPEPITEAVDRLRFYGNNGFGDDFGKRQARTILSGLQGQDQCFELVPSAVLAAGVSARGVAKLTQLMDKLR